MRVVNGAMAFVGDHEIEIGVAETARPKLPGDGVQRADDDLAFEAALAAVKQRGRIFAQVVVKCSPWLAWPVRCGRQETARGKSTAAWNHRFISMAMVSVLPVPVAISNNMRRRPAMSASSALCKATNLVWPRLNVLALEAEMRRHRALRGWMLPDRPRRC